MRADLGIGTSAPCQCWDCDFDKTFFYNKESGLLGSGNDTSSVVLEIDAPATATLQPLSTEVRFAA